MRYYSINTYFDVYQTIISPKLSEIDLFIKTNDAPYDYDIVGELLNISRRDILRILEDNNTKNINRSMFFHIMSHSNSFICGLYRRIVELGNPLVYTRNDISYIYNIDIDILNDICDTLEILEATNYMLPEIFKKLPPPNEKFYNSI